MTRNLRSSWLRLMKSEIIVFFPRFKQRSWLSQSLRMECPELRHVSLRSALFLSFSFWKRPEREITRRGFCSNLSKSVQLKTWVRFRSITQIPKYRPQPKNRNNTIGLDNADIPSSKRRIVWFMIQFLSILPERILVELSEKSVRNATC